MQKLIFPMKTVNITQGFHEGHKAWDLAGEDGGIDYWYAPCRIVVSAIYPYGKTGFYNTVIFTSCDVNGAPAPVRFADGREEIVSFSCTHMNGIDKFGLKVGRIYDSGEKCYCEGTTGKSTGNHVHMGVSLGLQTSIVKYPEGAWYMPDVINPDGLFFLLNDWNIPKNFNGYMFPETEEREETNKKEEIISRFEAAYRDLLELVRSDG